MYKERQEVEASKFCPCGVLHVWGNLILVVVHGQLYSSDHHQNIDVGSCPVVDGYIVDWNSN